MHDHSVRVAIEAALRSTSYCGCGAIQDLSARDGTLWLECRAFSRPSRWPARLVDVIREGLHDRRFVADLPLGEAS